MKSLHILVAEDNEDHAEMIIDALKEYNQNNIVTHFSNGALLMTYLMQLKKIKESMPDLVLLDIKMPVMGGLEALKLIKDNVWLKHIPVIMVSTSDNELDIGRSYENGANSYILKPFSHADFVRKMHEINRFWVDISRLPN